MSATWVTFLFEAGNFLLLAALLGWLFFRPVRDALERSRSELEAERTEIAEQRAQLAGELKQARTRRSEAGAELDEMRARVERQTAAERERLLAEARAEAGRELDRAERELAERRRAGAAALAQDAVFAASEVVRRLLERLDGPELEAATLEAAGRALERLREAGRLAPLVAESARELDPAALERLAGAAGLGAEELTARVDPDLLTGLRLITPQGVIDLSGRGLAEHSAQALAAELARPHEPEGQSP